MPIKRIHRRNINEPGHAHELTFSCYRRLPLLDCDRVRAFLAESINDAKAELDFAVWAYVFMPEHVHLIVYPRRVEYDIAAIRAAIKEPAARRALNYFWMESSAWLPQLERKRGHRTESLFWQSGGGYDRNIESAKVLLAAIEYIHLNPVRRGYVEHATAWKWSSATFLADQGTSPVHVDPIPRAWLTMP
jgi:putative transposase